MASKNVNKLRGRPKGSKNKQVITPFAQGAAAGSYTIEELHEKRRRSISLDTGRMLNSEQSFAASPAKRQTTRSCQGTAPESMTGAQVSNVTVEPEHSPISADNSSEAFSSTFSAPTHPTLASSDPPTNAIPLAPVDITKDSPQSNALLQQLLARFDNVELKLNKLDSMERQLSKLDAIESKTDNFGQVQRHRGKIGA